MKKLINILLVILAFQLSVNAQDEKAKKWGWLIPAFANLQYAGGVGNYIIGAGYTLNKPQSLRLAFQYGYTPKFVTNKTLHIGSLKFSYLPVDVKLYKNISAMPVLSVGISKTFADGPGTFSRLPSYYPEGYYAPNAYRFHFSLGANFKYQFKNQGIIKALELYVETTTNDLYMKYYFKYDKIPITHAFTMALGINIMFK